MTIYNSRFKLISDRLPVVLLFFIPYFQLYALDPHFSQFYASPLTLNPALTGISYGNTRFVANYRSQWLSVSPYQTFSASGDMSVLEEKMNSDFGGLGFIVVKDDGGLGFSQLKLNIAFSYHKALNAEATQYISFGFQGGMDQKSMRFGDLSTQNQWLAYRGFDVSADNGENLLSDNLIKPDVQAGALWYMFLGDNSTIFSGISVFHLTRPRQSFLQDAANRLASRYVFHGGSRMAINKMWAVVPNAVIMRQDAIVEVNLGTALEIDLSQITDKNNPFAAFDPNNYKLFSLGLWYRNKDAVIIGTSMEFRQYKLGLSYDITISEVSRAIRGTGGFELSLTCNFSKEGRQFAPKLYAPTPRL